MKLKELQDLTNSKSYSDLSNEAKEVISLILGYYDEQDLTDELIPAGEVDDALEDESKNIAFLNGEVNDYADVQEEIYNAVDGEN